MNTLWENLVGQESILSSDFFYEYGALYGPRVVLVAALSAITIFRREMSCNHCYVEQPRSRGEMTDVSYNMMWDEEEAEELLDGAGRYCSGVALLPIAERVVELLSHYLGLPSSAARALLLTAENHALTAEQMLDKAGCFFSPYPLATLLGHSQFPRAITVPQPPEPVLFSAALPADAHMHILSFLHPKDLVTIACVNRTCQQLIDDEESPSSIRLWKNIFYRDYAWLVESWDVGREAMQRSRARPSYSKEFYFRFSLSFVNYVLAGQNSYRRCLVGIGGHIYDLSFFLDAHPGSPETVMAHAGRDATRFFESMSHSMGARRIAQSLCVAVDMALLDRDACGVKPTAICELVDHKDSHCSNSSRDLIPSSSVVPPPTTFQSQVEIRTKGTLQRVREAMEQEEAKIERLISRIDDPDLLGEVTSYYDPMECKWKAWYTNRFFEVVFIDAFTDEM